MTFNSIRWRLMLSYATSALLAAFLLDPSKTAMSTPENHN